VSSRVLGHLSLRGEKFNRRYATREQSHVHRGLKPTAKFRASLRDEEEDSKDAHEQ
jgi:hypothetical protein